MKIKTAVSLVNRNGSLQLDIMLDSLFKSDIFNFEIFVYDNFSNKETQKIYEKYKLKKVFLSSKNDGIVLPRIFLMQEILKKDFDYVLEIHNDMIFSNNFFKPLVENFCNETCITMPFMIQGEKNPYPKKVEDVNFNNSYKFINKEKVLLNTYPVHPWLLSINCIKKINYYDEKFSPARNEDIDFFYRVKKAKLKTKLVNNSLVYHYGGFTRYKEGCGAMNEHIFLKKHNVSVKDFYNSLDSKSHHMSISRLK